MENSNNSDENKITESNAFLRERFLYLISTVCGGKKCEIRMFENTKVVGAIKAIDLNFENVIIEDLKTPAPTSSKTAMLRTSDILTMHFQQTKDT
ncbi:hypothetical protein NQ315_005838 [Exocentrus adspersus]|uniref:LSM domain-containing protein n=1 Tax=Exocentrus adspersus TaxID=1586481 RepID=A0AAV8VQU0_9CUCU|nr:hypothetical protein NQ315_005838 [Exocentrus adspersus]